MPAKYHIVGDDAYKSALAQCITPYPGVDLPAYMAIEEPSRRSASRLGNAGDGVSGSAFVALASSCRARRRNYGGNGGAASVASADGVAPACRAEVGGVC